MIQRLYSERSVATPSRAMGNYHSGHNGRSMPAVPVLQQKARPASPDPGNEPVQLYQPVDLQGEIETRSYNRRADAEARGSNAFGSDNLVWAKILLANTNEERMVFGASSFQSAHGEEVVLKKITDEYGDILKNDPGDTSQTRIVAIYTERAPCSKENADYSRSTRHQTDDNCENYLKKRVHDKITVGFSVPNDVKGHEQLMNNSKSRYFDEIVDGKRTISYQNAVNRTASYFTYNGLGSKTYKKYNVFGRGYYAEAQLVKGYLQQMTANIQTFGLKIDAWKILSDKFESIPHLTPSEQASEELKRLSADLLKRVNTCVKLSNFEDALKTKINAVEKRDEGAEKLEHKEMVPIDFHEEHEEEEYNPLAKLEYYMEFWQEFTLEDVFIESDNISEEAVWRKTIEDASNDLDAIHNKTYGIESGDERSIFELADSLCGNLTLVLNAVGQWNQYLQG